MSEKDIIKAYITGGYVSGKPEYGEICSEVTNEFLMVCDVGVTLKQCAKLCAKRYGLEFLRSYKKNGKEGMVLLFKANLTGRYLGLLHVISIWKNGLVFSKVKMEYVAEVEFISDDELMEMLKKLEYLGYVERKAVEGLFMPYWIITEKALKRFEILKR